MKILFVNEKCGYFGGVEQNVAESAAQLRTRGHKCYLAYGSEERNVDEYQALFDDSFPCLELGFTLPEPEYNSGSNVDHKSRENIGRERYSIEFIVDHLSPDVIYFHKVPTIEPFQRFMSQLRTVRMVHDHDLCCPRKHKYFALSGRVCHHRAGWRCWADGAFLARNHSSRIGVSLSSIFGKIKEMRRNFNLGTLLVASRFMKDELLMNGFPGEKIQILPPVLSLMEHNPAPIPEERRILFVGQLLRGKGVDLLLHALRRLGPDVTTTIVGAGNAENKLKALCNRLALDNRVTFKGWVDHDRLNRFYSEAKVIAVPSRWPEPFGMIGLEAMHHGRPVVGFDVGGIPDWLEHNKTGLIVPEQNVTGLAEALEQVLSNTEQAAAMGWAGFLRIKEKFTIEQYISNLESCLGGDKLTHKLTESGER